jgi:hypothetical protein
MSVGSQDMRVRFADVLGTSSSLTVNTTDDAVIILLARHSFSYGTHPSHLAAIGMTTSAFSGWISSRSFSSPFVPLPMYQMNGTLSIFSHCQVSFPSNPSILLSTVHATLMIVSSYLVRSSMLHISVAVPVIVPLSFLLTSQRWIQYSAPALWSALLISYW